MIDIWSRFHVAWSSRLSSVKIYIKYQCLRCETTVCVLCAPEIQNPEDEPEYKPMSKVGICNQCNNITIAGCRVETDDESVLENMKASNETRPVKFETKK